MKSRVARYETGIAACILIVMCVHVMPVWGAEATLRGGACQNNQPCVTTSTGKSCPAVSGQTCTLQFKDCGTIGSGCNVCGTASEACNTDPTNCKSANQCECQKSNTPCPGLAFKFLP